MSIPSIFFLRNGGGKGGGGGGGEAGRSTVFPNLGNAKKAQF